MHCVLMLTQSITPIPAMKKALSWGVFFIFASTAVPTALERPHWWTLWSTQARCWGMEEYTTYVHLLQTPTPTLPPPAHIFLCRPLPYPLCLSRLTHPYDNLSTIKSPNGPQVCQHASVTNKRNAFKRIEPLRCSWEEQSRKNKWTYQNLQWQLRIQREGNYIRLSMIKKIKLK